MVDQDSLKCETLWNSTDQNFRKSIISNYINSSNIIVSDDDITKIINTDWKDIMDYKYIKESIYFFFSIGYKW